MIASRRLALRLAFAGGMLGLLFFFVPRAEVESALRDIAPGYFALGVLAQFLMRAVATPRMRVVIENQGLTVGYLQLFGILLISQYYSLVLPGPLVGGGATWLKYVQAGASRRAAAAAVLLNRAISTLVMIVTGTVAWSLADSPTNVGTALVLTAVIASILLSVILAPMSLMSRVHASPGEPRWIRWVKDLTNRLIQFQHVSPSGKLIVLGSSLAQELAGAVILWCFARAVGLSIDLVTLVWMRAALQIVLMAPLHIAGLGLREATLVGLSSLFGVPAATAVAWSLLIFCGSLVVSMFGGLLEAASASRYFIRARNVPLTHPEKDSES